MDFPDGVCAASVRKMFDAVAGRIIVYFLANLSLLDREIQTSEVFELHPEETPIAYLNQEHTKRLDLDHLKQVTKDSGYASLHYVLRLRSSSVPQEVRPWFEVQVRTLVQDAWGEIEHVLGYKPEKRTSLAVRRQFQIIGSELTAIDEHFNLLYEELSRFQEEGTYADTNLLNAENLPPVLTELGIGCAQSEIGRLLKLLASHGFQTVGDLRAGSQSGRIEIIRDVYRSSGDREATNSEIVAGIAATRGQESEMDITSALKAQIMFRDTWEKLNAEIA